MDRTHYTNAPITEATIDLRIERHHGISVDDLAVIQKLVMDSYPSQESEYFYSGQMYVEEAGDPVQTESTHRHNGFRFTSPDKRQVFHARLDGFAFSVRAPYDRWEPFRDEARRLWDIYRSVTKAEVVTRVTVRYINQLDLPAHNPEADRVRMEDYLRVYPEVPRDWPGGGTMNSFFMQLQMWQEDLDCWLVVNEAPMWLDTQKPALFQLDFDFFREQFEEPWRVDDAKVWAFLEQLHIRKNEVFEASITEATRRLIK